MARRRLARHLQFIPPDAPTAQKYLLVFNSKALFHTPEVFPEIDSITLFGNHVPLKLEIGCGTADFLCAQAQQEPATNFVGVEVAWKPLFRAIATASSLRLDNLKFIKANFRYMGPLLVPDSLEMIYLHFPDPNTRPKFRKRRIFSPTFLDQVYLALIPGGCLSVMTDHCAYFEEMLNLVEQDGQRFAKTHLARYLTGFEAEVKSKFQQLWEGHGLPILRFEVEKRASHPEF